MTPDDIVLVNYHTSKHEGSVKPSSEKGLHCEIYALPSTRKITKKTVKALKGKNAALMANHGAVCVRLENLHPDKACY